MLVRLSNSGFIDHSEPFTGEIPTQLTKRARLVYVGDFESMDGPVTVKEEHLQKICSAYNGKLAKLKRLASGSVSVANLPPVQLDHNRSARDTVGRLENTDLTIEDWTDEEGKTRKALYGSVRFLGRDNVEKVLDGRWSTLSIGANFDDGKLDELSVTPFPAAEKATVLSRFASGEVGRELKSTEYKGWEITVHKWSGKGASGIYVACEGDADSFDFTLMDSQYGLQDADKGIAAAKKRIDQKRFSSQINKESAMKIALYQRIRKYLKLKKKMSDEQVEEKMDKLAENEDDEELKKLAEEAEKDEKKEELSDADDEEKKKLAEEEEKKKDEMKKKMSAARDSLTKLSADFRSKKASAELSAKAAAIGSRLSSIRASGRITPAELKKIDIKDLASKGQEAIDAVLKTYEDRQPVILAGQLGSMKAMSLKDVERAGKKAKDMSRLEAETRKNMSLLAHTAKEDDAKLSQPLSFSERRQAISDELATPVADIEEMKKEFDDICKLMDGGKLDDAKERLKGFIRLGSFGLAEPTMHAESMAQLASLQSDLSELSKKFDEALGLAQSLAAGE